MITVNLFVNEAVGVLQLITAAAGFMGKISQFDFGIKIEISVRIRLMLAGDYQRDKK